MTSNSMIILDEVNTFGAVNSFKSSVIRVNARVSVRVDHCECIAMSVGRDGTGTGYRPVRSGLDFRPAGRR
jgi:hypothetical protein